jgi:aspartyl-tRNA(Asn)/glutamyl-tRNA(Gln) amidotransferase subunit A
MTMREMLDAKRARASLARALTARVIAFDAVVGPTVPIVAPLISAVDGEQASAARQLLLRNTYLFNLTGQPAISIPCGFSSIGLPIGLQIGAPIWREDTVLRIAHAFQLTTTWHLRTPPWPCRGTSEGNQGVS